MTPAERKSLQERIGAASPVSTRDTLKWTAIWTVGLVSLIGLVVLILAFLTRINAVLAGVVAAIPILAAIICLYCLIVVISGHLHWRRVFRDFNRNTVPLLKRSLERGEVRARRVVASSVIEIEEFEDEGSGYIFAIGGGRSLLLKGQQYSPIEESMPWPASEFELVRSADGDVWIGLFSKGALLEPMKTVPMEQCTPDFVWSEREDVLEDEPPAVLRGVLETVQQPPERNK